MKDAINMTIQDAIQELDGLVHSAMVEYNTKEEEDAHDKEVLGMAVWAMKKQIPMKPDIYPNVRFHVFECSECGIGVTGVNEYCHKCGQKFKWYED